MNMPKFKVGDLVMAKLSLESNAELQDCIFKIKLTTIYPNGAISYNIEACKTSNSRETLIKQRGRTYGLRCDEIKERGLVHFVDSSQ
jgi:hypothetical protein